MSIGRVLGTRAAPREEPESCSEGRADRLVAEFEESGRGWFWETGPKATLSYVSDSVAKAMSRPPGDLLGAPFSDLARPDDATSGRSLNFYLSSRVPFRDHVVRANTEEEIWWSVSGRPVHDGFGRFLGFRGIAYDLTEKRRSEIELDRLARFDSLTGLPNREMIRKALEDCLLSAPRRKQRCSVMLLDLDRFKAVNDTLGHPVGDTLLSLVGVRLRDAIGPSGQIGRLGGDEFQAVLPAMSDKAELSALAASIIEAVSKPYYINSETILVGVSIGITVSDYDDRTAVDLVRDADLALYAAKAAGKGTHRFFSPEMQVEARQRQSLEGELRDAIEQDRIEVVYQPSVDVATERVVGFEALARWIHPERGPISPAVFVAVAEESGLIRELGESVLRTACTEAAKWPVDTRVAVNLSPMQFKDSALPSMVARTLAEAGLPASRLELEITESLLLGDDQQVLNMIAALKSLGVKLALDDFGTGYSSLGYLRTVPFDKIKIDRSFVAGACIPGSRNGPIIRAIVGLAGELSMETTAEGVETLDELELVRSLGCSLVQGYIYGKPMPGEEARILLGTRTTAEAEGYAVAREERKRIIRAASINVAGRSARARLRNISSGGALIECPIAIETGAAVRLDLGAGDAIEGQVRWSKGWQYGIKFHGPFDVDSLLRRPPLRAATGVGPDRFARSAAE